MPRVAHVGERTALLASPSIQADVVDYGRMRSGEDHAGLQFAFWGMSTKFALAAVD